MLVRLLLCEYAEGEGAAQGKLGLLVLIVLECRGIRVGAGIGDSSLLEFILTEREGGSVLDSWP